MQLKTVNSGHTVADAGVSVAKQSLKNYHVTVRTPRFLNGGGNEVALTVTRSQRLRKNSTAADAVKNLAFPAIESARRESPVSNRLASIGSA